MEKKERRERKKKEERKRRVGGRVLKRDEFGRIEGGYEDCGASCWGTVQQRGEVKLCAMRALPYSTEPFVQVQSKGCARRSRIAVRSRKGVKRRMVNVEREKVREHRRLRTTGIWFGL